MRHVADNESRMGCLPLATPLEGHAQTNCANNLIPAERLSERPIGRKRRSEGAEWKEGEGEGRVPKLAPHKRGKGFNSIPTVCACVLCVPVPKKYAI